MEEMIRDQIKTRFDKCLFIKAGAGAGKSTILVDRILNQILAGESPSSIVAITFTNKSAEDLKKKLLERLNEEVGKSSGDMERLAIIESAISNFNQMQVSTIHSFCNVLLSEQMLSSKLRKDVKMLQDNDLEAYLYDFFQKHFLEVDPEILDNFYTNYGRDTDVIFKAFQTIAEIDDSIDIQYRKDLLVHTSEEFQKRYDDFEAEVKRAIVSMYNRATNNEENIKNVKELVREGKGIFILKKNLTGSGKSFVEAVFSSYQAGRFSKSNGKNYQHISDAMTAAVEEIVAANQDLLGLDTVIADYRHALMMSVAMQLRKLYRAEKDSQYISNDQLLQRAYQLISSSESAWNYYHQKYHRIYVDEFQDTDHVQAQLVLALCAESYGSSELTPGKLVVVGDAKQSIYRFRGADLEEYYGFEAKMAAQKFTSEILTLKYNFRSSPKIIDWVNQSFGNSCLSGIVPISHYDVMDAKNNRTLKEGVVKPTDTLEGVYYMHSYGAEFANDYCKDEKKSGGPSAIEKDVKLLVQLIQKYVGHYFIFDRGQYRLVRYSDFLVLTKNANKVGFYSSGLLDAGIPVNVSGKVDIAKEYALNTYARVYNYLAHGGRDKNANKTMEFEGYGQYQQEDIVEGLRSKTEHLDGVALAYYLLNHLEYVVERNKQLSKNSAAQTMARLTQMVEKVVASVENDRVCLADGFFDYLQKRIEREMSLESEQNAVVLMNVHKSKGLQGKIVIICDRRADKDKKASHIHRQANGDLELYPAIKKSENLSFYGYNSNNAIHAEAKQAELEEYIRLEYVAATRAEEALIIFPRLSSPIDSNTKEVRYNCFMSRYDYQNATSLFTDQFLLEQQSEAEPLVTTLTVKEDEKVETNKKWNDITPSSLELHDDQTKAYLHDRPMGNVFGTIMHRMFELIVTNRDGNTVRAIDLAVLESLADLKEKYPDYLVEVERIKQYLSTVAKEFISSDIYKMALGANQAICEYPFFYFDKDNWVHGFSDLVLVNEDHVTIVDFKSDAMAIDETIEQFKARLVKSYRPQLQLYKQAMRKCFNVSEQQIETILYHLYDQHVLLVD